jgi:hypothetical protein
MPDLPPDPDPLGDARPRGGSKTNTPSWVYGFGVIAVVLVLLFVTLHVTGHSPGGH